MSLASRSEHKEAASACNDVHIEGLAPADAAAGEIVEAEAVASRRQHDVGELEKAEVLALNYALKDEIVHV